MKTMRTRYDPALRLFRLAQFLDAHRHSGVTRQEIAAELGVCPRTADRLRSALGGFFEFETTIEWPNTKRWRLRERTPLATTWTRNELAALKSGALSLDACGREREAEALRLLHDRLLGQLKRQETMRLGPDLDALSASEAAIARIEPVSNPDYGPFERIREATLAPDVLRLVYAPPAAPVTTLTCFPHGLLMGHRTVLIATRKDLQRPAAFVLDWIVDATVAQERVDWPEFDLDAYAEDTFDETADGEAQPVVLRFSATAVDGVEKFRFHARQTVETTADGGRRVRFRARGLEALCRLLLPWREHLQIEAPEELATLMRRYSGPGRQKRRAA